MIVRGFKSVIWVGAVGAAALSCYMVSLRVATERADLARVERQIVDTKRDIRTLETELDTRGRLTQLEDWNSNVLALSAPASSQFAKDGYQLAQMATQEQTVGDRTSAVRMASLETGQAAAPAKADPAAQPTPSDAAKPKAAPAAPVAMPRVVEAVAPATPQTNVPVRRASFDTVDAPVMANPGKAKAGTGAAKAPTAAKKVKTAAKGEPAAASAGHEAHAAAPTSSADAKAAPKPAKAHVQAKLARADVAAHAQSSGHRGGAQ